MKRLLKQWDSVSLLIAMLLLITALLHPTIAMKRDLHNYLFVVDVTQSMNTADMHLQGQPVSRLAYTRQLLSDAMAKLPCGAHVSLSVFSAESVALLFTPIEVCANYDVIQDSITHLEWRMAWRGNSRLRFGMQSAATVAGSLTIPAQVVFFTDGDESPKLNAINKTDLSNWQGGSDWLVIGVGGDEPFPIPKFDSEDKILGYWAYSNSIMAPAQVQSEESEGTRDNTIASDVYDRYLSKLDEPYLKELSSEIGADYLRADNAGSLIKAMQEQKPAGEQLAKFQIDWILIVFAIGLLLAGYWHSFQSKFRESMLKGQV